MKPPPAWILARAVNSGSTWTNSAAREGVTILLTTHILDEADRCDRLALLHQGNVVAEGTPEQLRSRIGGDVVVLQASETADAVSLAGKSKRASP